MKHVFVETNFLIDTARPIPSPAAEALLERQKRGDLRLHLPWCSVVEAKRTLDRIVREDLGFIEPMMDFVVHSFKAGSATFQKPEIDKLATQVRADRSAALKNIGPRIDAIAAQAEVIEPTKDVVTKTLQVCSVKSLNPFDEMVLGAVLHKAGVLHAAGERQLWFCNLNTKDFAPDNRPNLQAEYSACGLTYLPTFQVP